MKDTPRTQELREDLAGIASEAQIWKLFKKLEDMERELTAVTEQRDGLKQAVDCANDLLASVTEHRDRLAEALLQMWPFIEEDDYPNCNTPEFNAAILKYKEALQSLTTNEL